MKRILSIIGVAALLATTTQAAWYSDLVKLNQDINNAKELTVAVYPGYAPDLTIAGVKKPWGAGVALLYPVAANVFIGGRIDYLGDSFWAPSAEVGLKLDVILFNKFAVTPFTVGGVIVPLAGAGSQNGDVGAIVGAGIKAHLWTFAGGKGSLDCFYVAEHWTIFSGVIHRPGLALTYKF